MQFPWAVSPSHKHERKRTENRKISCCQSETKMTVNGILKGFCQELKKNENENQEVDIYRTATSKTQTLGVFLNSYRKNGQVIFIRRRFHSDGNEFHACV